MCSAKHSGDLTFSPASDMSIPSLPNLPPSVASCSIMHLPGTMLKILWSFWTALIFVPQIQSGSHHVLTAFLLSVNLSFSLPHPSPPSFFQTFHPGFSNKIYFFLQSCYCHPPRSQAPAICPHSSLSLLAHLIMARLTNLVYLPLLSHQCRNFQ